MSFRFSQVNLSIGAFLLIAAGGVLAEQSYSPYADTNFPQKVYWGDTHLHTNLSVDSVVFGNNKLGPDDAYRFAKGLSVIAHNGMKAQLSRPLDFLVIADHAFNLGLMNGLDIADPILLNTRVGKDLYSEYKKILGEDGTPNWSPQTNAFLDSVYNSAENSLVEDKFSRSVWAKVAERADHHNDPGRFTSFIGYEWTSPGQLPSGNLHRVVIFEGDARSVSNILPFSVFDSKNPEDLWAYLSKVEKLTGRGVLAIPHNGNLSAGKMFAVIDFGQSVIDADYAKTRRRWEPLYETTQTKGDSESHPILSPDDNFSDYETWNGWEGKNSKIPPSENIIERLTAEYARSALKTGLSQQFTIGVNPFKFGFVGGTDAHNSLAAADENNFWGKLSESEPNPDRLLAAAWEPLSWKYGLEPSEFEISAAGYTGIWAHENTRESLFAAMKRKEVYASTGPRISVRFFGGWDYNPGDASRPNLAQIGYSKGVPMGGDLANAVEGRSPSFLIRAVKDPDGANLDRVQVIKGWHDSRGELHERIYNVALSDGRTEYKHGRAPAVGSTVDVKDASYTNSIGDPELAVVWQDPDFDRDELAFYYLRVLEIPTPRWTAYDAKFFSLKDVPKEIPMVTQERAYSSPIWYTP